MAEELYDKPVLIDTEYERERLHYRPQVKYEPKKPYTVSNQVEGIVLEEEEVSDNYKPVERPTQQYEDFATTLEELEEMLTSVENELADVKISLSEEQVMKIYNTAPNISPIIAHQGFVDFGTYMDTFDDPDNPANVLIQDLVHAQAEDVDGSLKLELYEDMRELQATVKEGYFLFREAVLKSYLGEEAPRVPVSDPEFSELLDEAIKEQKEQRQQITNIYKDKEASYYESLRTDYGSPEFFQATKHYNSARRNYDIIIREEKGLNEMMGLTDNLLIGSKECVASIKSGLVIGSEIKQEEVMKVLENQSQNEEELTKLMQLSQVALKLQVNQQIEDKKQHRDLLRNINNLSRKKRGHDELLMAYELRNTLYLKLYDALQNLESPSRSGGTEAFLNQLAGGLSLIQDQYSSFIRDVYVMYTNEFQIRSDKISKVMDKEDARASYSLLFEYLQERGASS